VRSFATPTFEIRAAETEEVLDRQHLYVDAVLVADVAREVLGLEIVVFARDLGRDLYDSRKLVRCTTLRDRDASSVGP